MKNIHNIEIKISSQKVNYMESLNFMEERVFSILNSRSKEMIWFLNHDHIYTIGTSGNEDDIIEKINIPLIKTNRGGKITYHGPGQRIVYLLLNLNTKKKDVRKFVSLLENSVIKFLRSFNIEGKTFPNRIGIWVTKKNGVKLQKEKKIGAIGLRIKKWITYHGLSFNLNPNLKYYDNINACGLKNYSFTSMKELGFDISEKEFDEQYLKFFLKELKNF